MHFILSQLIESCIAYISQYVFFLYHVRRGMCKGKTLLPNPNLETM